MNAAEAGCNVTLFALETCFLGRNFYRDLGLGLIGPWMITDTQICSHDPKRRTRDDGSCYGGCPKSLFHALTISTGIGMALNLAVQASFLLP